MEITKQSGIGARIRELRRARDMSMDRLGQAIGVDASTINKMEKGRISVNDARIAQLSDALGVQPSALFSQGSDVQPAPVAPVSPAYLARDVPVLGTAAGSLLRGAFQIDGEIERVRRPPGLAGVQTAYAIYIEGESMVPEHNPGDLRFVHPGRPPLIGDSVVVQMRVAEHEPVEATIGRLQKRTATKIFLGKHNPSATLEIAMSRVIAVHKVMTLNDLYGV